VILQSLISRQFQPLIIARERERLKFSVSLHPPFLSILPAPKLTLQQVYIHSPVYSEEAL
jgi:hypothetical protein